MEARPCQISEFFNGTKQLLVPLFQRPYEWEKEHWNTLWLDLLERYESPTDAPVAAHFTGAIVTAPAKSVPVGVSKHLIIDGQQRLTTVAILLCVLRSFAERDTPRYRKLTRLLVNEDDEGFDRFKLLPTQPDRAAFARLIDGNPAKDNRFGRAYDHFRRLVGGKDSEGALIDIDRLTEALQSQLTVVSIHLSDADDPYLIFESLNAKGAPLTQADLIRNYFLLRLHEHEQQSAYETRWLPMQELLTGDHLTEFMRQYLMLGGEDVSRSGIYSTLKNQLYKIPDRQVQGALDRMYRCAHLYARVAGLAADPCDEIQRRLVRLARWEVGVASPLILKLLEARDAAALSEGGVVAALALIESYVVRRWVCRVPTNQLKRIFLAHTKEFPAADIVPWLKTRLAVGTQGGRRWPKDEEFKEQWQTFDAYVQPFDRCRLALETLEDDYEHKEQVSFDGLTIEHVLPQTLTDSWRKAFGTDAEESHAKWCGTLGNLTLTAYNSELSNAPYEEKRPRLQQSHLEINREIAKSETWDAETIQKRGAAMCARAAAIWPGPD